MLKSKAVVISQEAFDFIRQYAFEKKKPMSKVLTEVVLAYKNQVSNGVD